MPTCERDYSRRSCGARERLDCSRSPTASKASWRSRKTRIRLILPSARSYTEARRRGYEIVHPTILLAKDAGLRLDQIRAILGASDGPARKELLRRRRDELDRRPAAIEASRRVVQHGIDCRAEDFTRCPHFLRIVEEKAAGRPRN